jgi:hypothetical protein
MRPRVAVQWLFRLMAIALAGAAAVPAYAQGCAMCYNDAAAAKSTAIQALRSGTLILLFPVLLLFVGILAMAFRSRNRFNESEPAWELVPAAGGDRPAALGEARIYGRLLVPESERPPGDWDSKRPRP